MKKIDYYPSIFTPEDTNSMAKQLVLTIELSGNSDKILLLAKETIETHNLGLTKVLNSVKLNPFTKPLKGRDTFRDSTYRGGRDVTDGMTQWVFDEEKQEAAIRIKEIFVRHGWELYKYGYSDQSSASFKPHYRTG